MPTLQEFYNYIFRNDWADPKYGIPAKVTREKAALQIQARKVKMKALFDKVINYEDKNKFRAALRTVGAEHLETELYGNVTDKLEEKYAIRDDYQVMFDIWDSKSNYFQAPERKWFAASRAAAKSERDNAIAKFTAFYQVSKVIADFIEHNNTDEDQQAHRHAYWMLIVFGDQDKPDHYFKTIDLYLKKHNYLKIGCPLHDALVWGIAGNVPTVYLSQWRKIINETGMKAFQLFPRAGDIGRHLGSAPQSYIEARKIARTITYKRSNENPELADLFTHYNVPDTIFVKTLEIHKREKKSDNLPTVVISGADFGVPRYYLVKLPVGDLRAYILGHITNCCQSMGSHSEACVIDGVTLANNGFLILLKEPYHTPDTKEEKSKPRIRTESDVDIKALFAKCRVMGQGYMWITRNRNLTIDSWENLNPTAEDAIAARLLRYYADNVIAQKDSQIVRVTIGTGGKTPAELHSEVNFPEKMLEGIQYNDSFKQSLLAYSGTFQSELSKQLKVIFPEIDDVTCQKLSDPRKNYSHAIKKIVTITALQDYLKQDDNLKKFAKLIDDHECSIWNTFAVLDEAKLCTPENIANIFLLDESTFAYLESFMHSLNKAGMLNQDNLGFFFSEEYRKFIASIGTTFYYSQPIMMSLAIVLESLADLKILNQETFNLIASDLVNIKNYENSIVHLQLSNVPIRLETIVFLKYYETDSVKAIDALRTLLNSESQGVFSTVMKTLSWLTFGSEPPDVYRYIKDTFSSELKSKVKSIMETKGGTVNYGAWRKKNEKLMDINFIMAATGILNTLLAKSHELSYAEVLTSLTTNGNLYMLEELFRKMPRNIQYESLFKPDNYKNYLFSNSGISNYKTIAIPARALEDNTILLLCAASHGHSAVVDFFIEKGADLNLALYIAVHSNQVSTVELLLKEKKANPSYTSPLDDKSTLLMCAVYSKNTRIAELLLDARADVNLFPEQEILSAAIKHSNIEIPKLLIQNKVEFDRPNRNQNCYGYTPLMSAVHENKLELVRLLLDEKADINAISTGKGADGDSVLHCTAFAENPELIQLLIERRANIEAMDDDGYTALQKAVKWSHPDGGVIKMFLQLGAKSDLFDHDDIACSALYTSCHRYPDGDAARQALLDVHSDYMISKKGGHTLVSYISALTHAARSGNISLLEKLKTQLPKGMEYKTVVNSDEFKKYLYSHTLKIDSLEKLFIPDTALSDNTMLLLSAAVHRQTDTIKYFSKSGADLNVAAYIAAQAGKSREFCELIELKADPNYISPFVPADSPDRSLLGMAVNQNDLYMFRTLLDARANVNDLPEVASLFFVLKYCYAPRVKQVIELKAEVDRPNQNGKLPLLYAVQLMKESNDKDNDEIIKLLLEAKANINARDISGSEHVGTVLHNALLSNNPGVIKLLVECGADIDAVNDQGLTTLQKVVADVGCNSEIVKVLLLKGAKSDLAAYDDITRSSLYQSCLSSDVKKILEDFYSDFIKKKVATPTASTSGEHAFFSGRKEGKEAVVSADALEVKGRRKPE